jgi:hypothetical protein
MPISRDEQRATGRCYDCPSPAKAGRTRCAPCLASSAKATEKYSKTDKGKVQTSRLKPYKAKFQRNRRRAKGRFAYVRQTAQRKKLEFSLSESEYMELIALPCQYCKLPTDVETGVGLDRIDNQQGYVSSNVVPCCSFCNYVRADRFTPEEMLILGKAVRVVRLQRTPGLFNELRAA